jgi:hypothetical protein
VNVHGATDKSDLLGRVLGVLLTVVATGAAASKR